MVTSSNEIAKVSRMIEDKSKDLKVLVLANFYPSHLTPTRGTFIYDQVLSMHRFITAKVIYKKRGSRMGYAQFLSESLLGTFSEPYDLVHAHFGFHSALVPSLCKCFPLVVTFHGSDALIEPNKSYFHRCLQRKVVSGASHLIAVSKQIREKLVYDLGADPEKISVIPCGVDTFMFKPRSKIAARRKLGIRIDKFVVLFIGRLTKAKGLNLIREAARRLESVEFMLIGQGPLIWNAPNCTFLGSVLHSMIPLWINAADIMILPSETEGTSVAILESLASETPMVCSRVGGSPDLIVEGVTGLLIPPNDSQALADAIDRALNQQEHFTPSVGREMVLKNYSLEHISDKIHKLYLDVVGYRNHNN